MQQAAKHVIVFSHKYDAIAPVVSHWYIHI